MPQKKKKRAKNAARRVVRRKTSTPSPSSISKKKSKLKITILAGGLSDERAVSLATAKNIARYLDRARYSVRVVNVDERGKWRSKVTLRNTDLVFIGLHGTLGEDGSMQGYLETFGIPYTGSGVTASAVGMNKVLTKQICMAADIAVPAAIVVSSRKDAYQHARLPAIVKPVEGGSSIGVSIVRSKDELRRAVATLLKKSDVLIELLIAGREISVSVIGTNEPRALAIAEIIPQKGESFFSYDAKYKKGLVLEEIPARLPEVVRQRAERTAIAVHKLIGARGYSRVDMILTSTNECRVLEINTLPGLTPASTFPKCAAASGIPMSDLLDMIISDALRSK